MVNIVGPFWKAEARVVELADPVKNSALRALFVENTGAAQRRRSTTLIMLAEVRKVRLGPVRKGERAYNWTRRAGRQNLALLLVEADDTRSGGGTPAYTCLTGEISLDMLRPLSTARRRLYAALGLEEATPERSSVRANLYQAVGQAAPDPLPPARLTVHGSGLSVYGRATLPWQEETVAAPFRLTSLLPGPGARLDLEVEHLTAAERANLTDAWQDLGDYLNPGKEQDSAGNAPPSPHWVTLEQARIQRAPVLYWTWDPSTSNPAVLHLGGHQFELLLSDQLPYGENHKPTSLARIALDDITVRVNDEDETLRVQVAAAAAPDGASSAASDASLVYTYTRAPDKDSAGQERLALSVVEVAYDPIETARFLRNSQGLSVPEWLGAVEGKAGNPAAEPVEPAVVWGLTPLEDGWAGFPVPNLTEQIYFDADLERSQSPPKDTPPSLLQGAMTLGNDDPEILSKHESEQPWNLTLIDGRRAGGKWTLAKAEDGYDLNEVSLTIEAPRVVANGLLWLSTGRPTAADALPDLEDWAAGLRSISLRTIDTARDLFPPLATFVLGATDTEDRGTARALHVSRRQENEGGVSARLEDWSLAYQADEELGQEMADKKVLPLGAISAHRAWLWRRHPALPMVQALPLTQSQSPPNYPSASRQLAPLAPDPSTPLVLGLSGTPGAGLGGAAEWPRVLSPTVPVEPWQSRADLPLVALSLPGLVLDPTLETRRLGVDAGTQLPVGYRFDLPYTDEINALAQTPEPEPDAEKAATLPDAPAPEPALPLTPDTFAAHWQRLSDQASLASADAVEAFVTQDDEVAVRHLVEPFDWPVRPDLDLAAYPGALTLSDAVAGADAGPGLELNRESALRGISGRFLANSGSGQLSTSRNDEDDAFLIEAGSMAAHAVSASGGNGHARASGRAYRDQRGLWRQASRIAGGSLLRTPVQFKRQATGGSETYELVSTPAPYKLLLGPPAPGAPAPGAPGQDAPPRWQIWFRDVPVRTDGEGGTFTSADAHSARARDVNDPEALSRELDFLAGYEWRLGKTDADPPSEGEDVAPLPLFGLHFYPLTLEKVTLNAGSVQQVEITGRLQLPLDGSREMEEFDNAVRLTFGPGPDEEQLQLVAVARDSASREGWGTANPIEGDESNPLVGSPAPCAWPLALDRGEDTGAARLLWDGVGLVKDGIQITGLRLRFFLFGVEWTHAPEEDTLTFPQESTEIGYDIPPTASRDIYPQALSLALDPGGAHALSLTLDLELGSQGSTYRVRPGDTLSEIGLALGIDWRELAENNGISPPFRIRSGQVLRIPGIEPGFRAGIEYVLAGPGVGTARLAEAKLFGDLARTERTQSQISLGGHALQFEFALAPAPDTGLQLLPGIKLRAAPGAPVEPGAPGFPGFAALTFAATANPGGLPSLHLTSAYAEALLFCHWQQGLQGQTLSQTPDEASEEQVFSSSSGDLACGYTTQLVNGEWQESLLFNGVLEVKNLISWPAEWTKPQEGDRSQTELHRPLLPADGRLNHTRHTIRILFNQHQVPVDRLVTSPDRELLFDLHAGRSWQFLAVVEHQLVDIAPDEEWQTFALSNERRWTALQEVRLVAPDRFHNFLNTAHSTAPRPGEDELASILDYGYLQKKLRRRLSGALRSIAGTTMIVEASAPHWIDSRSLDAAQMTTLQFLPNGSQHAIVSHPEDYASTGEPGWLLLPMPFLGRLQVEEGTAVESNSALQMDPIRLFHAKGRKAPVLAWSLSHWRQKASGPNRVRVAGFDTALGRTWARLDPASLQENWFRLQNPAPEARATTTQSVLAALPDTAARPSRATALRRAFDAFRPFYPPQPGADLAPPIAGTDIEWRRDSLLVLQGARAFEGEPVPGRNRITNGAFAEPATSHPLNVDRPDLGLGGDLVPQGWQVFEFAYEERHYRHLPSGTFQQELISSASPHPLRAPRRSWGLPRMDSPEPAEKKAPGPLNRGTSWLLYTDANKPFWIKVGQRLRLEPGRYRLSLSVYPAQESSGVPATDPDDSQVRLFAGTHQTASLDGSALPFDRWTRASLVFEVPSTRDLSIGVELHGPGDFLRNGWYLNDAELVRLPDLPEGWHVTATQLRGLGRSADSADRSPSRHAAATLMPAQLAIDGQDNPRPLSFAVSPYHGLEFRPAGGSTELQLASVELLCLDLASGLLRPAASTFWEAENGSLDAGAIQTWAQETHRRLCPESPIAVLRFRQIMRAGSEDGGNPQDGTTATLTTNYRFAIVPGIEAIRPLARRVFSLRAAADRLRFREGQYGGSEMPTESKLFELAPPQTTGVQPLYLTERPKVEPDHPDGETEQSEAEAGVTWPWGLSALRISVQYTRDKQGAIGLLSAAADGAPDEAPPGDAPPARPLTLWWQAPQHQVQYRVALSGRPGWGLPALYRARAIKSLLPVLPAPPLPAPDLTSNGPGQWQPVLPGSLRYTLSGARAGVFFAVRNQLLRQSGLDGNNAVGQGLVSGSIPVQHRMPRPVPLPANHADKRDTALQPWAGHFTPEQNVLASATPTDEAFLAAGEDYPARRLQMKLESPARGAIGSDWNGELAFKSLLEHGPLPDPDAVTLQSTVELELSDGRRTVAYEAAPEGADGLDRYIPKDDKSFKGLLSGKPGGQTLTVRARVMLAFVPTEGSAEPPKPDPAATFSQTLTFPLRVVDVTRPQMPLASATLADEAFLAAGEHYPTRRLRMTLESPARGAVGSDWSGELAFATLLEQGHLLEHGPMPDPDAVTLQSTVNLELSDRRQTVSYKQAEPKDGLDRYVPEDDKAFESLLRGNTGGQTLTARARVVLTFVPTGGADPNPDPTATFSQTLTFLLRIINGTRPQIPLAPYFLHFEDPEYNRRLASEAASASGTATEVVGGEKELRTITLAVDRREYNPDSRLALRYDWDDGKVKDRTATLSFRRLTSEGTDFDLTLDGPAAAGLGTLAPAALKQISLADLRQEDKPVPWKLGDALDLKLAIPGAEPIHLEVYIVQAPVIPAPEAAYALLRWQQAGSQVACARFAWQPNASRITLVSPEDLRTGVVRRRAVFQWHDSVRPGSLGGYAIQKIAQNGATHFPEPTPVDA